MKLATVCDFVLNHWTRFMSKQKHNLQQRCQPIDGIEVSRVGATGATERKKQKSNTPKMAEKIYCHYNHRRGVSRATAPSNFRRYKVVAVAVSVVLMLPVVWLLSSNTDAAMPPQKTAKTNIVEAEAVDESIDAALDEEELKAAANIEDDFDNLVITTEDVDEELDAIVEPSVAVATQIDEDTLEKAQALLTTVKHLTEEAQNLQKEIFAHSEKKPLVAPEPDSVVKLTEPETQPPPKTSVAVTTEKKESAPVVKVSNKKSEPEWIYISIKSGDNLSNIFDKHKLNRVDLHRILKPRKTARLLRRLHIGQLMKIKPNANGTIDSLVLELDNDKKLQIHCALEDRNTNPDTCFNSQINTDEQDFNEVTIAKTLIPSKIEKTEKETAVVAKKSNTEWLNIEVKSGDNLSKIFAKHNLSRTDLHTILKEKKSSQMLTHLKPGQEIRIQQGKNGSIQNLSLGRELQINRAAIDKLADMEQCVDTETKAPKSEKLNKVLVSISGKVRGSFFNSGKKAGLTRSQVKRVMKIFRWDIDFAKHLRKGDTFTVLFEEYQNDAGKRVKLGHVVAAEFVNRGKRYQSVYYVDPKGNGGYHKPDGKIMRKAFLRTPVNVGKITSRFSLARRNPVLHKIRAHKGVDYGAPRGTPIYAAGSGVVKYKGWKRGYGRTVILQHGKKYQTLYAHLSKFPKGLKVKQKVNQGKIIGYVGSSGRATGPHLHYEFLVNGVHKDPLKVTQMNQNEHSVPKKYRNDFRKKSKQLLARLNKARQLARADIH